VLFELTRKCFLIEVKMETNKEQRLYTTLDAYRAGFLKLQGHEPSLAMEQNSKVVFCFPLSDKLVADISAYENGAMVDAIRFSMAVKSIKTMIFSLKKEEKENV
jgi:hypothetical protein